MKKLLLILLMTVPAKAQTFVNSQYYPGNYTVASTRTVSYDVKAPGDVLLVFAANNSPVDLANGAGNLWAQTQTNGGYSGLFLAVSKVTGVDTFTITYSASGHYNEVYIAEYAGKVDKIVPLTIGTGVTGIAGASPASAGELTVELGNNYGDWSNTYVSTSGQTIRGAGSQHGLFLADGGSASVSGTVSASPYGTAIFLVSLASAIVPKLDSVTVSAKLVWCATCDGTDDTPMSGQLHIAQGAVTSTYVIGAQGTASGVFALDVSQDPIALKFTLADSNGNSLPGQNLSITIPAFEMNSASFIAGVVNAGIVRIAHATDAAGNPSVALRGLGPVSIAR